MQKSITRWGLMVLERSEKHYVQPWGEDGELGVRLDR